MSCLESGGHNKKNTAGEVSGLRSVSQRWSKWMKSGRSCQQTVVSSWQAGGWSWQKSGTSARAAAQPRPSAAGVKMGLHCWPSTAGPAPGLGVGFSRHLSSPIWAAEGFFPEVRACSWSLLVQGMKAWSLEANCPCLKSSSPFLSKGLQSVSCKTDSSDLTPLFLSSCGILCPLPHPRLLLPCTFGHFLKLSAIFLVIVAYVSYHTNYLVSDWV